MGYWGIKGNTRTSRGILGHLGGYWDMQGDIGTNWGILGHTGDTRKTRGILGLGYSGGYWDTQGGTGNHQRILGLILEWRDILGYRDTLVYIWLHLPLTLSRNVYHGITA